MLRGVNDKSANKIVPRLVRNAEHRNAVCVRTLRREKQAILQLGKRVWVDVSDLLLVHVIHKPSTSQLRIDAVRDDESAGVTS